MIPGGNILKMALSVIKPSTFLYYPFLSRTTNEEGNDIAAYDSPITITGSVQPIPRDKYQEYGLDFQKNYIMVYLSQDVIDIERDTSGDQVLFNSQRYTAISRVPWFNIDGWSAVICIQVEDAG